MTRSLAIAIVAILIATTLVWAQPQQGFGPTFDPSNLALRVNVVAGSAGGLSPSTFGTAFPTQGAAVGGKDPNGAFASMTISSTGRLQVTCDNCSSSAATFGTAYPSSGAAIGYKDTLGAFASVTGSNGGLNVNVLSGGGGSSNFGTGFPAAGVPGGYRDTLGSFASFTGSNGKQNVIVGNESTLVATATQGASSTAANAWSVNIVSDAGVMVRPGDDTNKAMRVNIVGRGATVGTPVFVNQVDAAGNVIGQAFGTGFSSPGIPGGYRDANGSFASFTGSNGKQNVIVGNESTLIATVTGSVTVSGTVTANQGSSASAANAWPINVPSDAGVMVRPGDDTNKAIRVNVVAGGTTNSTFGTAFPTTGIAGGYRDANGAFASYTGSNGKQNVIVSAESTLTATVTQAAAANLNATVAQGASAVTANGWPIVNVDDAGVMVRAGDATNKAMRVNVVAGSGGGLSVTDAAVFQAASSQFVPGGGVYNDATASLAQGTQGTQRLTANRANHINLRDSAGREIGARLPGQETVPLMVQAVPQLPSAQVSLGAKQTTIVNVPQGQAPSTPLRGVTAGGGMGSYGWVQPWVRCDRTASLSLSNTGLTQVVAAVTGQTIYVCGAIYGSNGTTPFALNWADGTGTNCNTASSEITGAIAFAASGGLVNAMSPIPTFETRPGNALCARLSNGAPVGGHVRYTQF